MLNDEIINRDFENWTERIETAKRKLLELPTGYLPTYKERKKCKDLERKYIADVRHVEGLFKIAIDGIGIHGFKMPDKWENIQINLEK